MSIERSHVPAATRALTVLRALSSAPGPMTATALANACELPRSTTYHLLTAMAAEGFVVHYPEEQRWGLGVAAFEIGSAYLRHDPLERLGRPLLTRLVAKVGKEVPCVAHLGVLHGPELLYLAKEQPANSRHPVTVVTDVGVRLPAHLTASGRALLAELPYAQVRALFPNASAFINRTGAGPSSLSQLRALLSEQSRRGWFGEDGEVTEGYASVAAAAHDHDDRPVASIGLTFHASDVTAVTRRGLASAVRTTADELTRRLGGGRMESSKGRVS